MNAMERGSMCEMCGVKLQKAHGHAVVCKPCWNRYPSIKNAGIYRKARHNVKEAA